VRLTLMASDFHRVEFGTQSAAKAGPRHSAGPSPASPPVAPTAAPPDSVLVPIDQWNRLLGQLGNIHEAGQQLAEARERMGRAETENDFLKERIRDLRAQLERQADTPIAPVVTAALESSELARRSPRKLSLELPIPEWLLRRRKRNP
jgi:hypothetical protein